MLLAPRSSRSHVFLAVSFSVKHDGLSERGTTRNLNVRRKAGKKSGQTTRWRVNGPTKLVYVCSGIKPIVDTTVSVYFSYSEGGGTY